MPAPSRRRRICGPHSLAASYDSTKLWKPFALSIRKSTAPITGASCDVSGSWVEDAVTRRLVVPLCNEETCQRTPHSLSHFAASEVSGDWRAFYADARGGGGRGC